MDATNFGIDPGDVAELNTRVGTTGALGMAGLADDPIFEFTIGIVVMTNGMCAD